MHAKRIVFDYKIPWCYPKAGIAAFVNPLLPGLCEHFPEIEFVIVAPGKISIDTKVGSNCRFHSIYESDTFSSWKYFRYSLYDFPVYLSSSGADLVVSPYYDFMIPRDLVNKLIVTVHDTCFFDLPLIYPRRTRYLHSFWLKRNLSRAAAVLTVSEFSSSRIKDHFSHFLQGKEPQVIYNTFVPPVDIPLDRNSTEALRRRLAVPSNKRVFLYTGGFDVRKNLPRLFAGFKKVLDHTKAVLIVTGTSRDNPKLTSLIRRFGLERDVILSGFLTDDQMFCLYHTIADCAVSVSLYEGFGRSAVESMIHGLPFVSSPLEVVREFVGDYPVYCDPLDVSDIYEKMVFALSLPRNDCISSLDERFSLNRNIDAFCTVIEGCLSV